LWTFALPPSLPSLVCNAVPSASCRSASWKTASSWTNVGRCSSSRYNVLNLFQGFAITAAMALQFYVAQGLLEEGVTFEDDMEAIRAAATLAAAPMLDHVDKIITQGNATQRLWLHSFFAHMVQKPDIKPGVMIVLYSKYEGAGKNVIVDKIAQIIGRDHTYETANTDDVFGTFNESTDEILLLTLNEVSLAGKQIQAKLKDLLTRSTINVHRKFCSI
jgi:hypothetical protein